MLLTSALKTQEDCYTVENSLVCIVKPCLKIKQIGPDRWLMVKSTCYSSRGQVWLPAPTSGNSELIRFLATSDLHRYLHIHLNEIKQVISKRNVEASW